MKLRKSKNKKLIKKAQNFMPYDYGYLMSLEKQALVRMYHYFRVSKIAVGNDIVARDIMICLKLLDIIDGTDSAYHCHTGDHVGFVDKYINTRNWQRFYPSKCNLDFSKPIMKDDLREEKAWNLYNKMRYYKMKEWWD